MIAPLVYASCDGVDGPAPDLRGARCEGGWDEGFSTIAEAVRECRRAGWLVGRPNKYHERSLLCPVCRRAAVLVAQAEPNTGENSS